MNKDLVKSAKKIRSRKDTLDRDTILPTGVAQWIASRPFIRWSRVRSPPKASHLSYAAKFHFIPLGKTQRTKTHGSR